MINEDYLAISRLKEREIKESNKSYFYKILGFGLNDTQIKQLKEEELIVLENGLAITIHFKSFSNSNRYSKNKKTFTAGAIVITRNRFSIFVRNRKYINISFDNISFFSLLHWENTNSTLTITFNSQDFNENSKGKISVTIYTCNGDIYSEFLTTMLESYNEESKI